MQCLIITGVIVGLDAACLYFSWQAIEFFVAAGRPLWFLSVLIPLLLLTAVLSLAILVMILLAIAALLHGLLLMLLKRYGVRAMSTVTNVHTFDKDGETCLGGLYVFYNHRGEEYKIRFETCVHWPSEEQWAVLRQGYSKDAQNLVYYFKWWPLIHHVEFPKLP